jgi:hypothetical protein
MNEPIPTGFKPFCDAHGDDFREDWAKRNPNDLVIHCCAVALEAIYKEFPCKTEPHHPLECVAALARRLDRGNPTDPLANVFSTIAIHTFETGRLTPSELMMIAEWAQTLAEEAKTKRKRVK